MQATNSGAPSEPFLQQEIGGRPFGLWCIWLLGITGWFCLVLGLWVDEVGAADFDTSADRRTCQCGYATSTCTGSGHQNVLYSDDDDEAIILQQLQAGEGWFGLLIMSMIFSLFCCIGTCKDYFDGDHDSFKPSDYWDGCPLFCVPCGFSSIGLIGMIFWSFCGLFWYVFGETCSTTDFWEEYNNGVADLTAYGGFSMALIIMSLIALVAVFGLVFYEKKAFGAVPTGDSMDIPIVGDFLKPRPKSNTGIPQTSPQAPSSTAPRPEAVPPKFSATNNVTNTYKSNTNNNNNTYSSNKTTTYTNANTYNKTSNTSPPQPPPTMSKPITGGTKPKLVDPALMSAATGTSANKTKPKGPPPRPGGPPPVPKPKYQE